MNEQRVDEVDELLERRVRSRVRDTSIEAFRNLVENGVLSKRRAEAYSILYQHGPMTSNEVFQHANLHGNPNYRHNTNARMTELRDLGVAAEIGTATCKVTKRRVILWDVTSLDTPRKLSPRKSEIAEYRKVVARLFVLHELLVKRSGDMVDKAELDAIRKELDL